MSALKSSALLNTTLIAATLLAAHTPAIAAAPGEGRDDQALARLGWMPRNQVGMLNVDANEGQLLSEYVIKAKTRRALEIGTSNGYSSIWIALGCRKTGGRLTTLEIDEGKVRLARENFRVAGVDSLITLVHGDALREIPRLNGPFEFVFIDAEKSDYVNYLDLILPLVPPGGIIMAHNTRNLRSSLVEFIKRVQTDPQLRTVLVEPGPGGFSISVKLPPK